MVPPRPPRLRPEPRIWCARHHQLLAHCECKQLTAEQLARLRQVCQERHMIGAGLRALAGGRHLVSSAFPVAPVLTWWQELRRRLYVHGWWYVLVDLLERWVWLLPALALAGLLAWLW